MSIETLKPQLLAWLDFREIGAGGNRWATGSEVGAPAWVAADVFLDGSGDLYGYGGEIVEEFDSLLRKHGVWYELSCQSIWLYPEGAFDEAPVIAERAER